MNNLAARLRHLLDAARRRWQSDDGGVGIREVVAILAVAIIVVVAAIAILDVVGFEVVDWLREQLGVTSSG